MTDFFSDFLFLFQRFTWLSFVDILLVTLIFFALLYILRDTQAMTLLRGVLFLVVFIIVLTSLLNLPAFSWLVSTTLPALLLAIPVIFAPEIRRTLERIGRAGSILPLTHTGEAQLSETISAVISATARLSARQHGALIIFRRLDKLDEYIETGVRMDARITPETLLQIFYPNTPLHDGAVIISNLQISAAACIMPLSSSGILNHSPERQMGLRHRAALGISEVSDSLALVVSEENGDISIAQSGRIIRDLSTERLAHILTAFYRPLGMTQRAGILERYFPLFFKKKEGD